MDDVREVVEVLGQVVGTRRLADRYRHAAGKENSEIHVRKIGAGREHDHDFIVLFKTAVHQILGDRPRPEEHLGS